MPKHTLHNHIINILEMTKDSDTIHGIAEGDVIPQAQGYGIIDKDKNVNLTVNNVPYSSITNIFLNSISDNENQVIVKGRYVFIVDEVIGDCAEISKRMPKIRKLFEN